MVDVARRAITRYTEADFTDFAHIGPTTLAGRYLRTFWQPVYLSEQINPGEAKPMRMLGEDLTLYRGEDGQTHMVGFRCAHRAAQMSLGWVEGDCIRCFYHGWKYDATGQCVEQPAEPRPFADKVKIPGYPVQEYLGLIFAYMGEDTPPPLPRYPEFEEVVGLRYVDANPRSYNFFQNVENSLDLSHTGFVHRTLPGTYDGITDSPTIHVEEDDWGFTCEAQHPSGRRTVQGFGMPNVNHIKAAFFQGAFDASGSREFIGWKVPVDDENHIQFLLAAIRVPPDTIHVVEEIRAAQLAKPRLDCDALTKEILAGRMKLEDLDQSHPDMILLQDAVTQASQRTIADRGEELLGNADAPILITRRLWEREMRAFADGRPLKEWAYFQQDLQSR